MPLLLSYQNLQYSCAIQKWNGKSHAYSQDRAIVSCDDGGFLVALFDGMGGLPHAYEAAREAGGSSLRSWESGERNTGEIIIAANQALIDRFGSDVVGVAAAVAVINNRNISWSWLGDVRVMIATDMTKSFEPVTRDHTRLAEALGRNPTVEDVMEYRSLSARLSRSLGERTLTLMDVPLATTHNVISVCLSTDGFWGDKQRVAEAIYRYDGGCYAFDNTSVFDRPDDDASIIRVDILSSPSEQILAVQGESAGIDV